MLHLNFLEIETNKIELSVQSKTYDGNWEQYKKLQSDYPDYFFYLSHGKHNQGSKIFSWKVSKEASNISIPDFYYQKINNETRPDVFIKIIESSFVHLFRTNNKTIYKQKYSHVWNLFLKETNTNTFKSQGFKSYPLLKFSFHFLKPKNTSKIIFGISVQMSSRQEITYTDKDFKSHRIDARMFQRDLDGKIIPSQKNVVKLLQSTNSYSSYLSFKKNQYSLISEAKNLKEFEKKFNLILQKLFLPDNLKIKSLRINNIPNSLFQKTTIPKPTYYFYNEGVGGGFYNDRLKSLKPASFDSFRGETKNILLITPLEYEGSADSFSVKIEKTLREVFHLESKFHLKTFNHKAAYAYSTLLKSIDASEYDLIFQVLSEDDKRKEIKKSPYFVFKAKMLNQKTTTQKVLIETIRRSSKQIIDAIALNIYSKLGGTAWTIEKDEKNKTEIIIGIGSTVDFNKNRIIGFANVLDYNGNYITGDCTQITEISNYREDLQKHLIKTVEEIISLKNIRKGEGFRLIFHLTKEAGKRHEIKAIKNTLAKFRDYKIQFGIVHLSFGHNFRIYSNEGKDFPDRGSFIQLSENLALLHLGKPSKIPILIRRDKRSTYQDIYSMTKQVLFFTHLSHRSFRPSVKPVTIQYPSLMAKLISELKEVPDWDKNVLNHLKETLWFI